MKNAPIRLASIIIFLAGSTAAMAVTPTKIERQYDAAKNETIFRLFQKLEKRDKGEIDLFAIARCAGAECTTPPDRFTISVMWIGLERMFSTPAAAAVYVDGEELFFDFGRHSAEIDGGTIDESISFDLGRAVVERMTAGEDVIIRADELRLKLSEADLARLRELLRATTPAR